VDIGAGTCGEDEYFATKGLKIICTDINDLAPFPRRDDLKYVACDGEQLPFSDGIIAFVLYDESLHHLPSPANSLREAARILKPGGKVFMSKPQGSIPG
jgi:ubiquinone/menaquinone biosynthesis C-methylase UbiE